MKWFVWVLWILITAFALFAIVGLLLPRDYSVPREIVIKAKPSAIFPYIDNPSNRKAWSPFQGPSVNNTFEGPEAGVGAIMHWASLKASGRIVITESDPPNSVKYETQFDNGYPTSTSKFTFAPVEGVDETHVIWDFYGKVPFNPFRRYYVLRIDEKTGGKHFQGLINLKQLLENQNGPSETESD